MTRNAHFRALLNNPPLLCLGAHDPITARLAEQAGAQAVFVSGFAASAVIGAYPDMGLVTQTEMFEHIRRICRATGLPVFADADTGHGGPLEAQRTIRLWEEAGASALHVEDQLSPKKCGAFAGKQVIPAGDMVQKLRAMLDARSDPDFFVVARTDSFGVVSYDETIERLTAYSGAGADALFVASPMTVAQLDETARRLKPLGKTLLCLLSRAGDSPYITVEEARRLGYDLVIAPIESLFSMHKAVKATYETFLTARTLAAVEDHLTTFEEFNEFIGVDEYVARQKKFG